MRVLLAIARYDYGRPELGDSYEYMQWWSTLHDLGHEVHLFDTFDPAWGADAETCGRALVRTVDEHRPDLVLMLLIEHEVPVDAIDEVRQRTTVVNWFADDTWRYRYYSRHLAPHFSWIVTTCRRAEQAYRSLPGVTAHFRPWGYNPAVFHPVDLEPDIDVGFVGQRYGRRGRVVERLRAQGFSVDARGSGWPGGRLDADELARQFSRTRVNLNFLESSAGPFQRLGLSHVRGTWRADRLITRVVRPPLQLKARPFEITACGGFVLTDVAPELPEFFRPGEEIGVFDRQRTVTEQVAWYLEHEDERRRVAAAGLARAADYSWERVLGELLEHVA